MISISKPKLWLFLILLVLSSAQILPRVLAVQYTVSLPNNTIYFDDFQNYPTTPCTTAALACLPGWGAYDNATGGVDNVTTWHPYSSSGKSLYMASPTVASGKFDRHHSWTQVPGQTRITISQWFQFDTLTRTTAGPNFVNRNEIHFSLELAGTDNNFHECVAEIFFTQTRADTYVSLNDGVFNYNMSLNEFDRGTFAGNPEAIWDNNQWHFEKITMDFPNSAAPTCPYFQLDNVILSNKNDLSGWVTTFGNKVNFAATAITATSHNLFTSYSAENPGSLPLRLEIAMVNGGSTTTPYHSWHTNILITDDTSGAVCGPLCLSAVNLSLFYNLIMVAVGGGAGSSFLFGARRVIKGEPFKSVEVLTLLGAGIACTVALTFMIIIASNVRPLVPGG